MIKPEKAVVRTPRLYSTLIRSKDLKLVSKVEEPCGTEPLICGDCVNAELLVLEIN